MARICRTEIETAWGGCAETVAAIHAQATTSAMDHGPLSPRLIALGHRACAGQQPDLIILATTKGDCPLWVEDVLAEEPQGHGGPLALASELSQHFGCPAFAVGAACAGGLAALGEAARRIRDQRATRVLVLAGDRLAPFITEGFAALRAQAESCHPFSAERQGLVLSEAIAAIFLDDGNDSNHPTSTDLHILGWGATNDAHHLTGPQRQGRGLRRAAQHACTMAKIDQPDWICAHGTGTIANDASESQAYADAGWATVPITGWKGTLGHSLGGNALVELALTHHCLTTNTPIPGISGLREIDPLLAPVQLLAPGPHPAPGRHVLKAAAGFGGFNQAVIIGPRSTSQSSTTSKPDQLSSRFSIQRTITISTTDNALPRPRAREVLGHVDSGWGRLDELARCLISLCKQADLSPDAAVLLHTHRGCAAVDRAYEQARRAHGADANRFPYTLDTAALAEAMIRCGIAGPGCAINTDDDSVIIDMIDGLAREGITQVAVIHADSEPQAHANLTVWA